MATRKPKDLASTKSISELKLVVSDYGESKAAVNPWTSIETIHSVQKTEIDHYRDTVDDCRFFYRTEPVVSTVINKLVEIGVNGLVFKKAKLSDNEFRIFNGLKPKLLEFAEIMAQEYLLSGLVIPEISYGIVGKDDIIDYGVKKYSTLTIPTSMFVRDPKTIVIDSSMMSDKPSYYIEIPEDLIIFIQNKGEYPDGNKDEKLYNDLKTFYPEFVAAVEGGQTQIKLSDETSKLTLRRKYLSDSAYPIPYIAPVLDALKHKRELRRMDYSLIDKILGAILHVKVGSDEFPVTQSAEDDKMMNTLKYQLLSRFNMEQHLERIFQFFTNHTVSLQWIFPDSQILLNVEKYKDINQEILFGLGFPQVLITGEAQRTGTSDPEIAMIAPVKTMENFRKKIIMVIREICKQVAEQNNLTGTPEVNFASLNLHAFGDFMAALDKLYAASGVSRTAYGEALGYDFDEQLDYLESENTKLQEAKLPMVGPSPFSGNIANNNNQNQDQNQNQPQDNKPQNQDKQSKPAQNGAK